MFDGAAEVILGRLAKAAEAVGAALGMALQELAQKVRNIYFICQLQLLTMFTRSRSASRR